MEDGLLLDRYVLAQTGKARPNVCFIGTASGDSDRYLVSYYAAMAQLACEATHLALFERTPDMDALILAQDLIFVGGGNTKSMLAVWRDWGLDQMLRQAYEAGIVLSGVSAGAICWFEPRTDRFVRPCNDWARLPGLFTRQLQAALRWRGRTEAHPASHACCRRHASRPGSR